MVLDELTLLKMLKSDTLKWWGQISISCSYCNKGKGPNKPTSTAICMEVTGHFKRRVIERWSGTWNVTRWERGLVRVKCTEFANWSPSHLNKAPAVPQTPWPSKSPVFTCWLEQTANSWQPGPFSGRHSTGSEGHPRDGDLNSYKLC